MPLLEGMAEPNPMTCGMIFLEDFFGSKLMATCVFLTNSEIKSHLLYQKISIPTSWPFGQSHTHFLIKISISDDEFF